MEKYKVGDLILLVSIIDSIEENKIISTSIHTGQTYCLITEDVSLPRKQFPREMEVRVHGGWARATGYCLKKDLLLFSFWGIEDDYSWTNEFREIEPEKTERTERTESETKISEGCKIIMELTDLIEKTKNQPEPKNNTEFKKLEKNIEFCKDRITDFLTEI